MSNYIWTDEEVGNYSLFVAGIIVAVTSPLYLIVAYFLNDIFVTTMIMLMGVMLAIIGRVKENLREKQEG